MGPISLLKRILYYVALVCLTLFGLQFEAFFVECENITSFLICVFLIPHYIFGLIFLKTKWILQLTIPLITTLISVGLMWLGMKIHDFYTIWYVGWEVYLIIFLSIVAVWEIAYQILKVKSKKED